jgi:hypothetical protein
MYRHVANPSRFLGAKMGPDRLDLSLEEYRALRATIRERGTARFVVATITFVSWGALALTALATSVAPAAGLIPLLVLALGFEVVFAMHLGVERIGRYIQARYESLDALPGWEHAIMKAGANKGSNPGIDPLFAWPFFLATAINLFGVLLMQFDWDAETALPVSFWIYAAAHAVLVARISSARRSARNQREKDLDLFRSA